MCINGTPTKIIAIILYPIYSNFFEKNSKKITRIFDLKLYIMSYELTGKLIAKYDTVQRTESFKTREFAIEKTDDIGGRTIVNYAKFQCVQDKTEIIDKVNIGDTVKVYFNIKGSKWEKEQSPDRRPCRASRRPVPAVAPCSVGLPDRRTVAVR